MSKSANGVPWRPGSTLRLTVIVVFLFGLAVVTAAMTLGPRPSVKPAAPTKETSPKIAVVDTSIDPKIPYKPRSIPDSGGFQTVIGTASWSREATLSEIARVFDRSGFRLVGELDTYLTTSRLSDTDQVKSLIAKARLLNYEAEPRQAYGVLSEAREFISVNRQLAAQFLFSLIYYQGVTALRFGETENCIACRGESSCILPISKEAQHKNPEGSRSAIRHFTEYLNRFPDDYEVQWLLNLAHMTLGEYPERVEPRHLISLERFRSNEFDLGVFRDIGTSVGLNRFNQSGGAIMEDLDNDGTLDVIVTAIDPKTSMAFYRNPANGTFVDSSDLAGVSDQLGGLNCFQADFNNDGFCDVVVVRGAWFPERAAIRPSLLQNNGDGTFHDVTFDAGLDVPMNAIAGAWADFDNDGALDLLICGERQPSRLYHSLQDGHFEEVASTAGVVRPSDRDCKGAAWFDYDNDGYLDLYLNYFQLRQGGRLLHNTRDGRFEETTRLLSQEGPAMGFSCWAWDYDNDGWLDVFASSADWTLKDIVAGIEGRPHRENCSRLFHNRQGDGFEDLAPQTGLGQAMSQMGSNFGDFDNDGFLDLYLGTGGPELQTLVPNRMIKNVSGRRFSDVTASSRTGNLQKGHGVSCADWDRDGQVDVFIQMGGPTQGDRYHNILFQNPSHPNHNWLSLRLISKSSNRSALGARIKLVTTGAESQTIHRHVSTGSSFGANPLLQTIGLGQCNGIETLEITWPGNRQPQTLHDVDINQFVTIIEDELPIRSSEFTPIPVPTGS